MSLIIAKQEENRIYIASDTKLTRNPDDLHPQQKVASPEDAVIKATVINPHICICFAGDLEGVDALIKLCRGIGTDLQRILNILLAFNKSSKEATEFTVAVSHHPFYKIFEIKHSMMAESKSSWIGSQPGFSEFQRHWTEFQKSQSNFGIDYQMTESLRRVCQSSIDPSVNGFVVSVSSAQMVFTYTTRIDMDILPQKIPAGFSIIGHGTAQQGGYSVHFFPANQNYTALAVYILQGNFGIVYHARTGGLLWSEVISDKNESEFAQIIQTKFGIARIASTPPQRR